MYFMKAEQGHDLSMIPEDIDRSRYGGSMKMVGREWVEIYLKRTTSLRNKPGGEGCIPFSELFYLPLSFGRLAISSTHFKICVIFSY
jgi:hypothetical protein